MNFHTSFCILPIFVSIASAVSYNNYTSNSTIPWILSSGTIALGEWESAYKQAVDVVGQLGNSEKITLITGGSIESVNWTSLLFEDGTQGVQQYDFVTGFSETSALVTTWDKELMTTQFSAIAKEFYGKGIQVTNAPTSQPLGRTPWGGRLVETLGQDSYFNGIAFGLATKAFVDQGIVPGGKHFLLNEQETNRLSNLVSPANGSSVNPYSSVADDKTLHETYLWPFYDGVKNGLGAVMCAMNKVNGSESCENAPLLQKILKAEIGFPGMVYPDYGAQNTALDSANGGEDYGSSQIWSESTITAAISNGSLSQARLDDMVVRNVIGHYFVSARKGVQPANEGQTGYVDVRGNHSAIVRSNGAASLVLLKNIRNALPLSKPRIMALFGQNAGPIMAGPNDVFNVLGSGPTYAGHLAGGTGSGQTSFPYLITPHATLTQRASIEGTMIRWILNDTYTSTSYSDGGGAPPIVTGGTFPSGGTSLSLSVPSYATSADVCLVFINALSGEGADRTELYNPDQDDFITTVATECNNTIVVINTVGARLLDAWIENENVTAVVYGGLLGQESGNSIMDVLYGEVNPSGKLAYTIAKNESDYPVKICETAVCNFTEGNFIDYKWFDNNDITPRYEFGYGLSYTTFEYSQITAQITNQTALSSTYPTGVLSVGGYADLWDEVISVTATISNSGSLPGNEVAQLYIQYPDEADEPVRQLRGFEKTSLLEVGHDELVIFNLRRRDISFWDVQAQKWAIARGDYVFHVGASSRFLPLNATLNI